MKETDFLIIGAGQSGLSAARHLQKAGKDFIILEKEQEVGDNWRNSFETMKLFTPAVFCSLPELPMALSPTSLPNKNQIADYFSRYAAHFDFPLHPKNEVTEITQEGKRFLVESTFEKITTKNIIISHGCLQTKSVPQWAKSLSIPYIHSNQYRSPVSIKGKKVLVIGSGNTAAQIIAELTAYFEVHWSTNEKPKFKSLDSFGKNKFFWDKKFNRLEKPLSEKKRNKTAPIYNFNGIKKKAKKAILHPEIIAADGNIVTFKNQHSQEIDFVLFATGNEINFDFINIDGFEYDLEKLKENQGLSIIEGIYFLGLPHQRSRSSHLIYGSAKDAAFIISRAITKQKN
ncbi:flavin-containing monooxygenase [Echinicola marina]|uniref:flavin-containing monooxygenase n=1 Tax=Echinicola marina TaxID=2859768 RepID=UPI001CF6EAC9|nr:NAD(P)/FAD-dependent oxidoreductase [Echinicola marina]